MTVDSISPSSTPVAQVLERDGQPDFHLVDLGGQLSNQLRASWGEKPPYKTVVDSVWLQPLLGGGSTVAASLGAGNVFLATANPAVLMPIGAGVGSAVLGSTGGIVAQAPFVAAGAALTPVLAPMMAFLTLSSMLTGAGLKRVQATLDELYRDAKADDLGRLRSADESLREIASQYAQGHIFSPAMIDQLGRSRDSIRRLHRKYEELLPPWLSEQKEPGHEGKRVVPDGSQIAFFAASRLLNLRADFLRVYLTYQDDREHAEGLQEDLVKDLVDCRSPFERLKKRLRVVTGHMEKARRLAPRRRGLKKEEEQLREILKLPLVRECSRRWDLTKKSKSLLLFQTRGDNGALKAYVTRDPGLKEAARLEVVPRKPLELAQGRELDESKQPEINMGSARIDGSEEQHEGAIASFRSELKTGLVAVDRKLSEIGGALFKITSEVTLARSEIDGFRDNVGSRIDASEKRVGSEIASFQDEVQTRFTGVDAKLEKVDAKLEVKLDEIGTRFATVVSELSRTREEVTGVRTDTMRAIKELDDRLRLLVWLVGIGLTLVTGATVLLVALSL